MIESWVLIHREIAAPASEAVNQQRAEQLAQRLRG
jgi:hypothetical protein